MILELIIMKLTLDAIMQHCESLASQQQVREQARLLKTRLLKLMSDYEAGLIEHKTFSEQEAEIMASLSKLTQQVNGSSGSQSFNTGLGF